jgi:hypothetical protein
MKSVDAFFDSFISKLTYTDARTPEVWVKVQTTDSQAVALGAVFVL